MSGDGVESERQRGILSVGDEAVSLTPEGCDDASGDCGDSVRVIESICVRGICALGSESICEEVIDALETESICEGESGSRALLESSGGDDHCVHCVARVNTDGELENIDGAAARSDEVDIHLET